MRSWHWLVLICVGLAPAQASAQIGKWWHQGHHSSPGPVIVTPYCPPGTPTPTPVTPPTTEPPTTPPTTPPDTTAPPTDFFAQAPPAGSASPSTFAPNVFGDQFGGSLTDTGGSLIVPSNSVVQPIAIANGSSTPTQVALFTIPNPSGGGKVGRLQTAEDINILPRDRFLFNYDFFSQVPLIPGGWDVNRFVFGVEKTFFNQNASVEIRLPVAATLNSDINAGAENTHTEFGNVRVLLKSLLYGNDSVNLAAGLGISLPTADDSRVFAGGVPLAEIRNETVILTPYIGALFTPNRRVFAQTYLAIDFDTRGNPTFINPTGSASQEFVGRMTEQSILQVDGQIGYWVLWNDDPSARLKGLAPFVELHYSSTLGSADQISGSNFIIQPSRGDRSELNLTAGLLAACGERSTIALGVVVPLRDAPDRSFDYQIGLRANWFFGPTAAQMRQAYYTP
jgi:hypothetical protein